MKTCDLIVAGCFLALAIALAASSYALPAGAGRVPGSGFFPRTIGLLMGFLGLLLLADAWRTEPQRLPLGDLRAVSSAAGLTLVYLLAWGVGPFALRTVIFLTLFLRLVGQSWRQSASVATALTIFVALAFQGGLRGSFD